MVPQEELPTLTLHALWLIGQVDLGEGDGLLATSNDHGVSKAGTTADLALLQQGVCVGGGGSAWRGSSLVGDDGPQQPIARAQAGRRA